MAGKQGKGKKGPVVKIKDLGKTVLDNKTAQPSETTGNNSIIIGYGDGGSGGGSKE